MGDAVRDPWAAFYGSSNVLPDSGGEAVGEAARQSREVGGEDTQASKSLAEVFDVNFELPAGGAAPGEPLEVEEDVPGSHEENQVNESPLEGKIQDPGSPSPAAASGKKKKKKKKGKKQADEERIAGETAAAQEEEEEAEKEKERAAEEEVAKVKAEEEAQARQEAVEREEEEARKEEEEEEARKREEEGEARRRQEEEANAANEAEEAKAMEEQEEAEEKEKERTAAAAAQEEEARVTMEEEEKEGERAAAAAEEEEKARASKEREEAELREREEMKENEAAARKQAEEERAAAHKAADVGASVKAFDFLSRDDFEFPDDFKKNSGPEQESADIHVTAEVVQAPGDHGVEMAAVEGDQGAAEMDLDLGGAIATEIPEAVENDAVGTFAAGQGKVDVGAPSPGREEDIEPAKKIDFLGIAREADYDSVSTPTMLKASGSSPAFGPESVSSHVDSDAFEDPNDIETPVI